MYLKSTYLREIELVRDKADPGSSQIKNLPEWNLDDLYSSENDKNLTIIFISHDKYNSLLFNKIYEIQNKTVNLKTNDK